MTGKIPTGDARKISRERGCPLVVFTGRWIVVRQLPIPPGRKTAIYQVVTKEDATILAHIRWYAPWRKYALFPSEQTVWEATCLQDITTYLTILIQERNPYVE